MRKLTIAGLMALLAGGAFGQAPAYPSQVNVFVPRQQFEKPLDMKCIAVSSQPLSAAGRASIGCDSATNTVKMSVNGGAFASVGAGTVTAFSLGTIGTLLSFSVATGTTTPALSANLATQSPNCVIAGPTSGGAAVPTCRALVVADVPALPASQITGTAAVAADLAGKISLQGSTPGSPQTGHFNISGTGKLGNLLITSGVSAGAGFQHIRTASCTTGTLINASCDTVVTWATPFADTSYTATATLDTPSGGLVFILSTKSKTTTTITVTLITLTAAASSGTINAIGIHD